LSGANRVKDKGHVYSHICVMFDRFNEERGQHIDINEKEKKIIRHVASSSVNNAYSKHKDEEVPRLSIASYIMVHIASEKLIVNQEHFNLKFAFQAGISYIGLTLDIKSHNYDFFCDCLKRQYKSEEDKYNQIKSSLDELYKNLGIDPERKL
jgi:hypothetical protein